MSATPASTPVKLVTPCKGGEARGPGSARTLGSTPFEQGCEEQPACAGAAPSSSHLPPTASAALERLASKLGAVAGSGNTLELGGLTWEEVRGCKLAAVGMQYDSALVMSWVQQVQTALSVLGAAACSPLYVCRLSWREWRWACSCTSPAQAGAAGRSSCC